MRTSLTGRHLYAKAALVDAPPLSAVQQDAVLAHLHRQLEERYQPIRDLIASAPGDLRPSLVLFYETCLQGPCVNELRDSLDMPDANKNDRLATAGADRILRAPLAFARLTATHYRGIWTAYKLQHPETSVRLAAFLAQHRPLPLEREAFKVSPGTPITFTPSAVVRWLQPLVITVGVFTIAVACGGLLQAARGRACAPLLVATLASIAAHGILVFSTVAAAGISRFMVGVSPAIVTASVLGLWWAGQKALGRPAPHDMIERFE
jgi:hypothetical protein